MGDLDCSESSCLGVQDLLEQIGCDCDHDSSESESEGNASLFTCMHDIRLVKLPVVVDVVLWFSN